MLAFSHRMLPFEPWFVLARAIILISYVPDSDLTSGSKQGILLDDLFLPVSRKRRPSAEHQTLLFAPHRTDLVVTANRAQLRKSSDSVRMAGAVQGRPPGGVRTVLSRCHSASPSLGLCPQACGVSHILLVRRRVWECHTHCLKAWLTKRALVMTWHPTEGLEFLPGWTGVVQVNMGLEGLAWD